MPVVLSILIDLSPERTECRTQARAGNAAVARVRRTIFLRSLPP
jgi:hypothetical protein